VRTNIKKTFSLEWITLDRELKKAWAGFALNYSNGQTFLFWQGNHQI
jgi:hypothetical protein